MLCQLKIRVVGQHDKHHMGKFLCRLLQKLRPCHARHGNIADHDIRVQGAYFFHRLLPIARCARNLTVVFIPVEHEFDARKDQWLIVHQQYLIHFYSSLGTRTVTQVPTPGSLSMVRP